MRDLKKLLLVFVLLVAPTSIVQATLFKYDITGTVYLINYINDGTELTRVIDWENPNALSGRMLISDVNSGSFCIDSFSLEFINESICGTGSLNTTGGSVEWLYLYGTGYWASWSCSLENDSLVPPVLSDLRNEYDFFENEGNIIPDMIWIEDMHLKHSISPIPEPSTFLLVCSGLFALVSLRKKVRI